MNKKIILLTTAFCLISFIVSGQKFTRKGETVSYGKEPMFQIKPVEYYEGSHNRLYNLDGDMIAYIINMNNYMGSTNIYNISFPATKQAVYITIVKGGDMDLLKMLNNNGVFKNNQISKEGVNNLSLKGNTVVNDVEFKDPETQDKELKAKIDKSPKESPEEFRKRMGFTDPKEKKTTKNSNNASSSSSSSNVSFTLKSNCSKSVRVFIGTKPKYGSGTTGTISSNSVNSRSGRVGDQLCIVDANDNPVSCITISKGMGRVEINSSGTGFGK